MASTDKQGQPLKAEKGPSSVAAPKEPQQDMPFDEKPFRLAKSFSLVSIVLIFAAVLTLATVVSRQAEIIITKRVEDDTIKLMENLNHQMYENFLKQVSGVDGRSRLREPAQQALLHEVITNTIYGFDLKRVLIYDPDGRTVYATDDTVPTSLVADMDSFQEALKRYQSVPRLRYVIPIYSTDWWRERTIAWLEQIYTLPGVPEEIVPLPVPEKRAAAEREAVPAQDSKPEETAAGNREPLNTGSDYIMPNLYSYMTEPELGELPELENKDQSIEPVTPEDTFLTYQRSQTVFRYDQGGYLFFFLFPRGDFVLRSYKAMESYGDHGISGVLEVTRDLTPEYQQIAKLQYFALSVAAVLALFLSVVLRWVVSRGEAIITKRNQERQALRERLDQAERLAGLGSMVATVAHEIRNPLGIIHSTADVLNRFLRQDDPDKAKLAVAIVEEANRLSEVVTEFLDFARPPQPRPEPIVAEDILEEILAFLELTLSRAGVEVRTNFRSAQSPVQGDGPMLHRAFLNLLINAMQAMDDGGLITITTRLETEPKKPQRLLIAISDTGPGLSEEARKKMFSPFYTTKAKGTGLGLVIVRNIIEAHGGEIELQNNQPPGSSKDTDSPGLTVLIHLPA